jgi:hypothetical protein
MQERSMMAKPSSGLNENGQKPGGYRQVLLKSCVSVPATGLNNLHGELGFRWS